MNKNDMIAVGILGALLVGWFVYQTGESKKQAAAKAARDAIAATNVVVKAEAPSFVADTALTAAPTPAPENETPALVASEVDLPRPEEERFELGNDSLKVVLSSWGGVITSSTLPQYPALPEAGSAPVAFEYDSNPVLAWNDIPGLKRDAAYMIVERDATSATFVATNFSQNLVVTRRYELKPDYKLLVSDTLRNIGDAPLTIPTNHVSLGVVKRGSSSNDTLGMDAMAVDAKSVLRLRDNLVKLLGGKTGMSCGSSAATAESATEIINEQFEWVALRSRFFVHFFAVEPLNTSLSITSAAKVGGPAEPQRISGILTFAPAVLDVGRETTRTTQLYIGPKRLSIIRHLGRRTDQLMEFDAFFGGQFIAPLCKILLPLLNFFYSVIPNYGIAIILLTFLVRGIFWPLTHKTAESGRKMAALQPKIKEIQAKFKDNPQKLQQETWALYRENKVNPLSSCLPMLIQLPVFIALFTVLRSAVELRYASFLWVTDLSEPENLLVGVLPIALNILPILMAGTMALQSYLTPSMGDPAQQRMMMIMMPIMMLFICYSFPSALALYWTVSQVISIVQLHLQRRLAARDNAAKNPPPPDKDDGSSQSRQMRRRLGRA